MRAGCSAAAHVAGHWCCPVKMHLDKGARWQQPYIHGACPIPKKLGECCGRSVVCGGAALLQPAQGWCPCMRAALGRWQLQLWEAGKAPVKWPERLHSPEAACTRCECWVLVPSFMCWCWTNEIPQIAMTAINVGEGEFVDLYTCTFTPWETEQVSSCKKSLALCWCLPEKNHMGWVQWALVGE